MSIRSGGILSALLWVLCAAPLLSGCGRSASTHYYTLTPGQAAPYGGGAAPSMTPSGAPGAAPAAASGTGAQGPCYSLGLGPVDFPAYLDRTQIVTQGAGNQMQLAEFDQWVEPLQENFKRILMENLAASLCTKPLVLFPWPAGVRPRYQLAIQVQRFDGALGQEAVLRANWSILNPDGDVLLWRSATLREPVAGPGYAPLAAAQSALVARFGQELAVAVKTLKP